MIPRRLLAILVFAIPLLLVAFTVLMAAQLLAAALEDELAATVLRWLGVTTLMLLSGDALLLVACLGFQALREGQAEGHDEELRS